MGHKSYIVMYQGWGCGGSQELHSYVSGAKVGHKSYVVMYQGRRWVTRVT